jgi:hypothetical protein
VSDRDQETYEGPGRVSVTIERGAKGPRWKVRTTDLASQEEIDRVAAQAVAAYRRLERELAARPFTGEEPRAPAAGGGEEEA